MGEKIELKACPFDDGSRKHKVMIERQQGRAGTACPSAWFRERVVCSCGARGPEFKRPNRAVAAWNTRAVDIEEMQKTFYRRGWNDRESDIIERAERILPPQDGLQDHSSLPEAWRPIESAPKDANVLLFCPKGDGNPGSTYRVSEGAWEDDPGGTTEYRDGDGRWTGQDDRDGFTGWLSWDGGFSEDTMMPTHWMPLPAPPAVHAEEG